MRSVIIYIESYTAYEALENKAESASEDAPENELENTLNTI